MRRTWIAFLALVIPACGGGAEAPPAKSSQSPKATKQVAPADSDAERREFMEDCTKEASTGAAGDYNAYCACGWNVFSKALQKGETENELSEERTKEIQQQIQTTCTRELPEASVKTRFVTGCSGGHEPYAEFCGCLWTELRKDVSVADLATGEGFNSPKVAARQGELAKTCGTSLPAGAVQKGFVEDCSQGEKPAFCDCAWKQVSAAMSPAEFLVSGVNQMTELKIENACAKLKSSKSGPTPLPPKGKP